MSSSGPTSCVSYCNRCHFRFVDRFVDYLLDLSFLDLSLFVFRSFVRSFVSLFLLRIKEFCFVFVSRFQFGLAVSLCRVQSKSTAVLMTTMFFSLFSFRTILQPERTKLALILFRLISPYFYQDVYKQEPCSLFFLRISSQF